MNFPWSPQFNNNLQLLNVVSVLKALSLPEKRKKIILVDWCKDVSFPYTYELFQYLRDEIQLEDYKRQTSRTDREWTLTLQKLQEKHPGLPYNPWFFLLLWREIDEEEYRRRTGEIP